MAQGLQFGRNAKTRDGPSVEDGAKYKNTRWTKRCRWGVIQKHEMDQRWLIWQMAKKEKWTKRGRQGEMQKHEMIQG